MKLGRRCMPVVDHPRDGLLQAYGVIQNKSIWRSPAKSLTQQVKFKTYCGSQRMGLGSNRQQLMKF